MRVLLVHNRYRSAQPSGENAVVDDESALLVEAGCEVRRLEVSSDEIASWSTARRASLPFRVVWSRAGVHAMRAALDTFNPDVVHVHNTFPLLSPAVLREAHRSGAAVVQTLHNYRPLCPSGALCESCRAGRSFAGLRSGCYRQSRLATAPVAAMIALHRALGTWRRSVDLFVCPSEFTARRYIEAGWQPERLVVKPNTVARAPRPRVGSGEGFVCISRLSREKGVDVLLDAWERAFPDGGARLDIVGSGDQEEGLRRRAAGLRGVSFHGHVDRERVLRVLARARGLVVPSRWFEVFPRTIVEAYALGVPVIAPQFGALAEIVDDGRTGLLVPPDDPDGLARALRRLEESPQLAEMLGAGARAAFDLRLSPETTTSQLLATYEQARARRRGEATFLSATPGRAW